jgi:hypothetical protein
MKSLRVNSSRPSIKIFESKFVGYDIPQNHVSFEYFPFASMMLLNFSITISHSTLIFLSELRTSANDTKINNFFQLKVELKVNSPSVLVLFFGTSFKMK